LPHPQKQEEELNEQSEDKKEPKLKYREECMSSFP
jgi:hypothetical protein